MLWRPLRDALPAYAAAATESPQHDALAARITRGLGGCVAAVATGPTGLAAVLWTREAYPPWYRLLIWSGGLRAMTPASVRVWGDPCRSADGCLAVAAFDGVRRGIVAVAPGNGATRWWSRPADASYRLLTLGPAGGDAVAVRGDRDGSAWLVRARPHGADHRMRQLRPADATGVEVVTWAHGQVALEGLLTRPPGPGPHALVVFLHGGPVGALAYGEHPDLSAWVSSGFAVFVPGFRGSGIAGERAMWQAFRRRGLPARDPEVGDVLSGVDMLVASGLADPAALTLLGHSYGGYLAGRLLARGFERR